MTGSEETLLARAEILEDTGDLAQMITSVLAGARRAGVDPAAVTSLQAAIRALDPGASTGYDASSEQDRHAGGGYRSDGEFLEAASEAEAGVQEHLREVQQLREHATPTAMDTAQADLSAAYAMAVRDPCNGCHGAREAAIQDALRRIGLCPDRRRDPRPAGRTAGTGTGPAAGRPRGPRRGLPAGLRVHPQGRQAARLRPVDRRRRDACMSGSTGCSSRRWWPSLLRIRRQRSQVSQSGLPSRRRKWFSTSSRSMRSRTE